MILLYYVRSQSLFFQYYLRGLISLIDSSWRVLGHIGLTLLTILLFIYYIADDFGDFTGTVTEDATSVCKIL